MIGTATQCAPIPHIGPYGTETEAFTLANTRGSAIRGAVHRPAAARRSGSEPLVIAVAGLGWPMRRTLSPALYLLASGFSVVRFDPTNAVGYSDGDMFDFSPGSLAADIAAVRDWAAQRYRPCQIGYFGASVSARSALRAAADAPGSFAAVGTLACVVNVRASLRALCGGSDPVAPYEAGGAGPGGAVQLLGHDLRRDTARELIEQDWLTPESTARDLVRAAPTAFANVHGGQDPFVAEADARTVFGAADNARLEVLGQAGHEFEFADRRAALATLLRHYRAAFGTGAGEFAEPGGAELAAQKGVEETIHQLLTACQKGTT